MDYTKEFLLTAAVALMAYGMTLIQTNFWQGLIAVVLAVCLFVGRGFYKKYLEDKNQ